MAIKLDKTGDAHRINLSKGGQELTVHINLNWGSQQSGGFFSKMFSAGKADLDLGCMYETVNGSKGVIQPIGGNFGSKTASPFIFLDKDDRSGASADGENMQILKPSELRRVMLFAFIYEGAANFSAVNGRMFFKVSNGEEVSLELTNASGSARFCAAALITFASGQISISKEDRYFAGHQNADEFYKFGFSWQAGSK